MVYNVVKEMYVFSIVYGGVSVNRNFGNKNNAFNKRALMIGFIAIFLVVMFILAVLFFRLGSMNVSTAEAKDDNNNPAVIDGENEDIVDMTEVSTLEMRGMWIASTMNIDYPSKQGLSADALKSELDSIVSNAYELGINSIFFQVRPASDALYNSDIFPASRYVSGTQGKTVSDFDSLAYILEAAKKKNIDVHAWVNPYRVSMNENEMESLAENNPAKLHPEYTIKYDDGKTYYNPGLPEVRKLIVDGVSEIVRKYPDIAGIHFDDYFYPYPVTGGIFDDAESYIKYSDGLELPDWRRNNVNALVKETYDAIKAVNPDCVFGVSVFGIWANKGSATPVQGSETNGLEAYSSLYCDARAWANGGYVDYIAPQNYWSFDTKAAPFDDVARWWNANLDGTGVDLYIGHAAYKSGDYDENEIFKQVQMCRTLSSYKGSIFYGYENIENNVGNVADDIRRICENKITRTTATSNGKQIKINYPSNNATLNISKSYIIGSCDPAYPLYVNGNAVSKTSGGYFGLYLDLALGKNTFSFTQNGNTLNYTINRGSSNSYYSDNRLDGMEIVSPYPSGSTLILAGDEIDVSCVAPAGSVVTASLGGTEVVLEPTLFLEEDGEYVYEKYTGSITPDVSITKTDLKLLGDIEFTAYLGTETATANGGQVSVKGTDAYVYAEVKEDYTYTKVGTSTSFYDDFLPSSKGMRDYVRFAENGYYKLRFGGYIAEDKLSFTYGKPLNLNTILTTALEVNAENPINNKSNSTDIRFGVTENIPVDVDFRGENGEMRIIIYNTDTSIVPEFEIPENPLVKSIEGRVGTRENMLMYYVTLKDSENFYGFNIVYENGCMIVKLNNPQRLASGDLPLLGKRIVVDAGHGGTDIGAPGPGDIPEKDLNRMIATSLAQKLRALGAEVVESRTDDNTVDLYSRIDILNNECPDLAISVHHNSVAASTNALKAKGFVALYSNNSGISLSKTISEVVCYRLGRDERTTAYQQLAVARNHRFPSTLLEMCFISNVEEYQWSITDGNAEKSADAIVEGVLEYYRNQEKYLDY